MLSVAYTLSVDAPGHVYDTCLTRAWTQPLSKDIGQEKILEVMRIFLTQGRAHERYRT